jgi:hypothetical protein
MTHLVTAPAAEFNGVVANQVFVDGVAEVTDKTALWYFREAGYTVEEIPDELADLADQDPADPDLDPDLDPDGAPPADPDADAGDQGVPNPAELDKPLGKRRVDQLVAFAAEQDPPIDLGEATSKAKILAAIQAELDKRAGAGDPGDGSDSGDGAGTQPVQPTA